MAPAVDRVVLVGCSDAKGPAAEPGRDLYRSALFRAARAVAERAPAWGILSARYGLVLPDQVIAPYDLTIRDLDVDHRTAWGRSVAQAITRVFPGARVVVMAGRDYIDALPAELRARVDEPMRGLEVGQRLQWLGRVRRGEDTSDILPRVRAKRERPARPEWPKGPDGRYLAMPERRGAPDCRALLPGEASALVMPCHVEAWPGRPDLCRTHGITSERAPCPACGETWGLQLRDLAGFHAEPVCYRCRLEREEAGARAALDRAAELERDGLDREAAAVRRAILERVGSVMFGWLS